MKPKYALLAMALTLGTAALAQEVDDMYFNAKDRVSQTEIAQTAMATRYAVADQEAVQSNPVNPSDSYTGRGVNPEFSAQQKNGAELIQENPDYFLSSYKAKDINGSLYAGSPNSSACNCGPASSYSGMGYGGFGNPYGGSYYPYGSPYGGLTTSIGYAMGSYGSTWSMGMSYGTGGMYGNPYGMYNPYAYSNYGYGYAAPYYATGGTSPDVVQSHGKRPVRASSVNQLPSSPSGGYVAGTNGRSRATGERASSNYYDPSWKSDPKNFPSRSYNYGGRSGGYSDSPGSTNGRSWGADSGTRTRSFDSFGAGSRGTMGSSGGMSGGGGGRSRGRN